MSRMSLCILYFILQTNLKPVLPPIESENLNLRYFNEYAIFKIILLGGVGFSLNNIEEIDKVPFFLITILHVAHAIWLKVDKVAIIIEIALACSIAILLIIVIVYHF
mgnify:CR=1 FL=1